MKPPVVVIGRHCKTNQCWIAVRFKKNQSVAKISQNVEGGARGRGAGKRVSRAEMFIFATHARAIVESFLVVVFALAPAEAAAARPNPDHYAAAGSVAEPAAAPARLACLQATAESTAPATASPIACTRFDSMRALGTTPPIATSMCAPA